MRSPTGAVREVTCRAWAVSPPAASDVTVEYRRLVISIPFHQRLLSYLQPILLDRSPSEISGHLELRLYHNRFQLRTADALYSDGRRYFPAVAVARHLSAFLPTVKRVLILGAGLGSIVQVMRARGLHPQYTLVEKDKAVLRWTRQILSTDESQGARAGRPKQELDHDDEYEESLLDDAETFMARNQRTFDLVFVDVFAGREVPDFVTTPTFLDRCRSALSPGGRVALNYLEVSQDGWNRLREVFGDIFPGYHVISRNDNRVLLSRDERSARGRGS